MCIRDRLQGHHHLGRREHFLDRGRGRALQASGRQRRRRGGEAGYEMGRDTLRLRRTESRRERDIRGARRLVPAEPRRLQMPALRGIRRVAENKHWENPEIQTPRDGEDGVSEPHAEERRTATRLEASPSFETDVSRPPQDEDGG